MKYLFILVVFLPLFSFAQSGGQVLQGLWVKTRVEMKDSSRVVDHVDNGMSFLKYNFKTDGFVEQSTEVLFNQVKTPFQFAENSLTIGAVRYDVLKLTQDTLIIAKAGEGLEDSKTKVFTFVKVQNIVRADKPSFNNVVMDSVYTANQYLFPQCNDRMTVLMNRLSAYTSGTLKVRFVVDKSGKVKDFVVLDNDKISERFEKSITEAFESPHIPWIPAKRNNIAVNTSVELTLKCTHANVDWIGIEYPFLPHIQMFGKMITFEQSQTEGAYYNHALEETRNKNYQKAVDYLNQCVEIDDIDFDAYYLRAILNLNLGNKDKACSDWTYLSELGQTTATKNLQKYCSN